MATLRSLPSWFELLITTRMPESEKYGFQAPTPAPTSAVSTVFLPNPEVSVVTAFGLLAVNIGIPTKTVLHKFVVLVQPGLAPLFMPKFAPKSVMVTAALNGADGRGSEIPVSVLEIDEISGAEYLTALVIEPTKSLEPHEITPVLAALIPPSRPAGILISNELSDIH